MLPIFEEIASYFELPGVQRAFIVAPLIALCSSLLGVTLVLKRYSFIGEGLSHMAFGAMAFAAVVGITNNMLIALPATVLAADLADMGYIAWDIGHAAKDYDAYMKKVDKTDAVIDK